MFMTNRKDKSGELSGQERRRRWGLEQKLAMVRESLSQGKSYRWRLGARHSFQSAVPMARQPVSGQCGRGRGACLRAERCAQADP